MVLQEPVDEVDLGPKKLLVSRDRLRDVAAVVDDELQVQIVDPGASGAVARPLRPGGGQAGMKRGITRAQAVEDCVAGWYRLVLDREDRVTFELGEAEQGADRSVDRVEEV
jgi:hypothetical protein